MIRQKGWSGNYFSTLNTNCPKKDLKNCHSERWEHVQWTPLVQNVHSVCLKTILSLRTERKEICLIRWKGNVPYPDLPVGNLSDSNLLRPDGEQLVQVLTVTSKLQPAPTFKSLHLLQRHNTYLLFCASQFLTM